MSQMNISKKIKAELAADQAHSLQRYFAQVNWNAHLVPVVKRTVESIQRDFETKGIKPPFLQHLAADAARGQLAQQKEEIWTDSIAISFGIRPIPAAPVVPVQGRIRTLAEEGAKLIFSRSLSGAVAVLMFPPRSEISEPEKSFYLIAILDNPGDLTEGHVKKMVLEMFQLDLCCSAAAAPLSRCGRKLAKLKAREGSLQGPKWLSWLKPLRYFYCFARELFRIYFATQTGGLSGGA